MVDAGERLGGDDMTFSVDEPLRVIIGGPPHSGKSTLMNLLEDKFRHYQVPVELLDLDLSSPTPLKAGFTQERTKKDWTAALADEARSLFEGTEGVDIVLGDSVGLISSVNEIISQPADVAILLVSGGHGDSDSTYRKVVRKWKEYYQDIHKPLLVVIRSSMNPDDESMFDARDNYGVMVGLDRDAYQDKIIETDNACLEGIVFEIAQSFDLIMRSATGEYHLDLLLGKWPDLRDKKTWTPLPEHPHLATIERDYFQQRGKIPADQMAESFAAMHNMDAKEIETLYSYVEYLEDKCGNHYEAFIDEGLDPYRTNAESLKPMLEREPQGYWPGECLKCGLEDKDMDNVFSWSGNCKSCGTSESYGRYNQFIKKDAESFGAEHGSGQDCCFCGDTIIGYGNNPAPLDEFPNKCCSDCNLELVIPARMRMMFEGRSESFGADSWDSYTVAYNNHFDTQEIDDDYEDLNEAMSAYQYLINQGYEEVVIKGYTMNENGDYEADSKPVAEYSKGAYDNRPQGYSAESLKPMLEREPQGYWPGECLKCGLEDKDMDNVFSWSGNCKSCGTNESYGRYNQFIKKDAESCPHSTVTKHHEFQPFEQQWAEWEECDKCGFVLNAEESSQTKPYSPILIGAFIGLGLWAATQIRDRKDA